MAPSTRPAGDQTGEWVTPSVSYVEPQRISCEFCGRPIARKYWRALVQGQALIFCEPPHADLYENYWLPTYGEPVRQD